MSVIKGEQGEREREDKIRREKGRGRKWKIAWEERECEG